MDVREKLVELLLAAQDEAEETCAGGACEECPATGANCREDLEVDYLIAHGVTLGDVPDTNVGKWISSGLAAHWKDKDECSACGFHEKDRRDLSGYNCCPNCGAKMGENG